jgi:phospholipid/cholesterol/gamma-HCH transport system ATP-binding protein
MERKLDNGGVTNGRLGSVLGNGEKCNGSILLDYLKCAPAGVCIKGLERSFGNHLVLKGIDLDIDPGEIVVILGESGAGKSVLLRHIIGLESPDAGNISVAGEDINDPDFSKHHVLAMVFQSSALFNSLTVEDNVALYLREHKVFKDDARIKEIVSSALELVGLGGKETVMPSVLSGGMKRRVATARALVMNPDIILFDEPTSGLDPMMTRTIGDLICDLKSQVEITQIVVTHDIDLTFYVADKIAVLSEGKILQVGTPAEIRSSRDTAVQEFISPQFS